MFFINLKQNVDGFLPCVSWLCLLGPLPSVANSSQYFSAGLSKNYGPWKQIFLCTHRAFFETFCVLIIGRRFLQQQALYIGRPFWVIGWKFRLLGTLPLPPPRLPHHTAAHSLYNTSSSYRLYIFALDNQDNCIIRSYTIMDLTKFCRKTFFIIVRCSISSFLCTCNLVSKQTVKFLKNNVSMYVHKKKCMLFFYCNF